MSPGEFEPADDSAYPNKALDEKRYVTLFGNALQKAGYPGQAIVDTSRNAVQGLRMKVQACCLLSTYTH